MTTFSFTVRATDSLGRTGTSAQTMDVTSSVTLYDEIMADAPWAYWQLGEAAGPATFLDFSGNSRHLSVMSGVTAGTTGLITEGTAVDFSGSASYITSPTSDLGAEIAAAFDGNPDFTIMTIINPDQTTVGKALFHAGNLSVNGEQGLFLATDNAGGFFLQMIIVGVGYRNGGSTAGVLTPGASHIIHAVRRKDVLSPTLAYAEMYCDGVDVTAGLPALHGTIGAANGSESRVTLGALNSNGSFSDNYNGKLQHMAVYTHALSPARIAAHHAAAAGL